MTIFDGIRACSYEIKNFDIQFSPFADPGEYEYDYRFEYMAPKEVDVQFAIDSVKYPSWKLSATCTPILKHKHSLFFGKKPTMGFTLTLSQGGTIVALTTIEVPKRIVSEGQDLK